MFKFSLPMKLIISSSSLLTIMALTCCLIMMSTSVHTSDIRVMEHRMGDDDPGASSGPTGEVAEVSSSSSTTTTSAPNNDSEQHQKTNQKTTTTTTTRKGNDARQRGGRLYQAHTSQQASSPLESYAAAYAAANSAAATAADQSAAGHLAQQSTPVAQSSADPSSAYASFGEASLPGSATAASQSASSVARQLATPADYSTHSNYFASYMSPSSNEASYSGGSPGSYYSGAAHHLQHQRPQHQHHQHHSQAYKAAAQQADSLPLGYPAPSIYDRYPLSSSYYDRMAAHSSPYWSASNLNSMGSAGLMSSASHALSHWTNGFSISEIICGLVALAIGAIILGAPFFLIYLALMGNFSGSGSLSLTNPTSAAGAAGGAAAPASGRRKRLAVFEAMNMSEQASNKHPDLASMIDSIAKSVSPYVDLQQVSQTFKRLASSIEKYSPAQAAAAENSKRAKQRSS